MWLPISLFTAWLLTVKQTTENRTGLGYLRISLMRGFSLPGAIFFSIDKSRRS
jgi:hypothetical protein